MAYKIRKAGADDAAFLVEMLLAAFDWRGTGQFTVSEVLARPDIAHYVAGWPRPGDLGVVATDGDGHPVGACWLRYLPADDPGYGWVAADIPELTLGVAAAHRNRGLGRLMLRELVRVAREAGVEQLSLSVEPDNHAHGLYLSEGFEVVGRYGGADTLSRRT
ncbi:GNAT family N-acetyltransferase [Hamadaea sp. NPDC051192]|uniref:GNAT family N-acetyltransferase n=1 Tax=Hamadaea sp. NPDC051192 TaxID=3154940 RepID=UPI00341FF4AE